MRNGNNFGSIREGGLRAKPFVQLARRNLIKRHPHTQRCYQALEKPTSTYATIGIYEKCFTERSEYVGSESGAESDEWRQKYLLTGGA